VQSLGGIGLTLPADSQPLTPGGSGGGSVDFPAGVSFRGYRVSPSVAQLQALAGTPIIAIPGIAGSIIVPLHWTWEVQQNASAITTSPNAGLRYVGNATVIVPAIQGGTNAINTFNFYASGQGGSTQVGTANVFPAVPTPPVGSDISINGANMIGGNDSVHRITIFCFVIPFVP